MKRSLPSFVSLGGSEALEREERGMPMGSVLQFAKGRKIEKPRSIIHASNIPL